MYQKIGEKKTNLKTKLKTSKIKNQKKIWWMKTKNKIISDWIQLN